MKVTIRWTMTAVAPEHKLVKYENETDAKPKVKTSRWTCCAPKAPKERRKHSRQFTQHEIDYTIAIRAKRVLIEGKDS